jgi:hypothetical protein
MGVLCSLAQPELEPEPEPEPEPRLAAAAAVAVVVVVVVARGGQDPGRHAHVELHLAERARLAHAQRGRVGGRARRRVDRAPRLELPALVALGELEELGRVREPCRAHDLHPVDRLAAAAARLARLLARPADGAGPRGACDALLGRALVPYTRSGRHR